MTQCSPQRPLEGRNHSLTFLINFLFNEMVRPFFFLLGARSRALAEVFPLVVRSKLNISVLTTHLFGAPVSSDLCLLQSMMGSHLHTFLSHCPYQRLDNINTGRPTTKIPLVSHFFLNLYVHSLCTMLDKVPTLP